MPEGIGTDPEIDDAGILGRLQRGHGQLELGEGTQHRLERVGARKGKDDEGLARHCRQPGEATGEPPLDPLPDRQRLLDLLESRKLGRRELRRKLGKGERIARRGGMEAAHDRIGQRPARDLDEHLLCGLQVEPLKRDLVPTLG